MPGPKSLTGRNENPPIFGDDLLPHTGAELIAIAKAELKAHVDCPDGMVITVLRSGNSWEFRASADAATAASPGYPECVAMLVQVGDHLGMQYDLKG
jgi:hypothetical protein